MQIPIKNRLARISMIPLKMTLRLFMCIHLSYAAPAVRPAKLGIAPISRGARATKGGLDPQNRVFFRVFAVLEGYKIDIKG